MGSLEIKAPDDAGHSVTDAATGEKANLIRPSNGLDTDIINPYWPVVNLPAGTYNVTFGDEAWQNVEVQQGKTTVLARGELELTRPGWPENKVLDAATGRERALISEKRPRARLIPGRVTVMFGDLAIGGVELKAGEVTRLETGTIKVGRRAIASFKVFTDGGIFAGLAYTGGGPGLAVPPGFYTVKGCTNGPVEVKEGQELVLK